MATAVDPNNLPALRGAGVNPSAVPGAAPPLLPPPQSAPTLRGASVPPNPNWTFVPPYPPGVDTPTGGPAPAGAPPTGAAPRAALPPPGNPAAAPPPPPPEKPWWGKSPAEARGGSPEASKFLKSGAAELPSMEGTEKSLRAARAANGLGWARGLGSLGGMALGAAQAYQGARDIQENGANAANIGDTAAGAASAAWAAKPFAAQAARQWSMLPTASGGSVINPAALRGAALLGPAASVAGAAGLGWSAGRFIDGALLNDRQRDAIGGTINTAVRGAGKLFGQDWGVDDRDYLDQRAAAAAAAGGAKPPGAPPPGSPPGAPSAPDALPPGSSPGSLLGAPNAAQPPGWGDQLAVAGLRGAVGMGAAGAGAGAAGAPPGSPATPQIVRDGNSYSNAPQGPGAQLVAPAGGAGGRPFALGSAADARWQAQQLHDSAPNVQPGGPVIVGDPSDDRRARRQANLESDLRTAMLRTGWSARTGAMLDPRARLLQSMVQEGQNNESAEARARMQNATTLAEGQMRNATTLAEGRMRSADTRRGQDITADTQANEQRVQLRGQDMTLQGHQLTAQNARALALRDQANKDRAFNQDEKRLQFDQAQAADKNLTDYLTTVNTRTGADGKPEVNHEHVAQVKQAATAELAKTIRDLESIPQDSPGYAEAQKQASTLRATGAAAIGKDRIDKINMQVEMQSRARAASGMGPFSGSYVDSADPSAYDIVGQQKNMLTPDMYKLRNGSLVPKRAVDYEKGGNAILPNTWGDKRTTRFDSLREGGH